jgi:hypothetical protein
LYCLPVTCYVYSTPATTDVHCNQAAQEPSIYLTAMHKVLRMASR